MYLWDICAGIYQEECVLKCLKIFLYQHFDIFKIFYDKIAIIYLKTTKTHGGQEKW